MRTRTTTRLLSPTKTTAKDRNRETARLYREAVLWIAETDPNLDDDVDDIATYETVGLVSALFGDTPSSIAAEVLRWRRELVADFEEAR